MFKVLGGLLLLGCLCCEASVRFGSSRSLQKVIIFFRHGDRSPINTYKTDPNVDYPWIGGYLALQPKGIERMYKLGHTLRNRYGWLIPKHGMYTWDTTTVLSSASERCILSAQSLLASFYEPPAGAINMTIAWQPVPVTVLDRSQDTILGQRRVCPKLDAVREKLLLDPPPESRLWLKDGFELKDFVSQRTGSEIDSMRDLFEICDNLEVVEYFGLTLPDWAVEVFPNRTNEFARGYQLTFSATDDLKRIRGGAILNELLGKMKSKHNQRLLFYSTHDVAMTNLFNTMGIQSLLEERPAFGAAVIFELYNSLGSDMEVRMLHYRNPDTSSPTPIDIPNCGKPCSLTMFELSIKDMLLDDYDRACSLDISDE
ncbi:prostatic acid phosphatase-like [Ochlerotatus camptorhynchus]|uniref:prostatic acid phosphatase-like n=1 Tax=Ochlerotatus camptorhynchus TaxID=644619 RepID=UPI0031D29BB6